MTDRRAIAKIKIAQKDLAIEDGDYRDLLERLTGQRSAAALSEAQCGVVLDEFKRLGWKPKVAGGRGRPARKAADHPVARKARALWLSLWNLGVVRDPSEASLEAFARRQLGVEQLQWADQTQGYRLIEALKAWAEREGWPQSDRASVQQLKTQLVRAQQSRRVNGVLLIEDLGGLPADLDARIAANGHRIRAAMARLEAAA